MYGELLSLCLCTSRGPGLQPAGVRVKETGVAGVVVHRPFPSTQVFLAHSLVKTLHNATHIDMQG